MEQVAEWVGIVSVASACLFFYLKSKKEREKDIEARAKHEGAMDAKLDNILQHLGTLHAQMHAIQLQGDDTHRRVIVLETQVSALMKGV